MNVLHLERARQYAAAGRRRADLERWREAYQRLIATPARTESEALAKHQALAALESAYPH